MVTCPIRLLWVKVAPAYSVLRIVLAVLSAEETDQLFMRMKAHLQIIQLRLFSALRSLLSSASLHFFLLYQTDVDGKPFVPVFQSLGRLQEVPFRFSDTDVEWQSM